MSTLSLQTFVPLVDKHGLSDEERPVPVEFVGDHERCIMINLLSLLFFFFFCQMPLCRCDYERLYKGEMCIYIRWHTTGNLKCKARI